MTPNPSTARSTKRRAELAAIAQKYGFKSWSAMLTAIKNEKAKVIKKENNMLTVDQKVLVVDGSPAQEGVIEEISDFGKVTGYSFLTDQAFFVRVPSWNNNTNGGRWLGISSIQPAPAG